MNKLRKRLRELSTIDRLYYDGKLSTLLLIIFSFLLIVCLIIICIALR